MTITNRLAKLEEASGINEPCEWCAYWTQQERLVKESLRAQGCTLHQPKPQDVKFVRCDDCGQMRVYDYTFLPVEVSAERAQLKAEEEAADVAGREVSRAWWTNQLRLFDREQAEWRAYYGTAYDVATANTGFVHIREFIVEQIETAPL